MEPRRFITASTNAGHLSLSCTSSLHFMAPDPTSWRSILILSSQLRLGLPSGFFPSGFPTETLYTPLLSPIRATCPTHLIFPLLLLTTNSAFRKQLVFVLSIVTTEYVLLNVGGIAYTKILSKICTSQLHGCWQRVWKESVWVVSFYTLTVKGVICNSVELGNDNRGKLITCSRFKMGKVLCP